jgi:hypothetical protein
MMMMITPISLPIDLQKQAFDEKAPFCKLEREPCGFYDLSLDGNSRLEWVKSWSVN